MIDLNKILEKKEIFFISGPCVIENEDITLQTAEAIKKISDELSVHIIFKSSYKKANRSSCNSFRGPGIEKGLSILSKVKDQFGLSILTDIHETNEVAAVSEVADIIQIPAFLCRQTELIEESAKTGKWINIKKGQFMAPEDMLLAAEKVFSTNNRKVLITERGSFFGYHNLVVDFRSIPILKGLGLPVIFDGTHSVQLPGGLGASSTGQKEFVAPLSKSACAIGANGFFFEAHPKPEKALSDAHNSLDFIELRSLIKVLVNLSKALKEIE